MIYSELETNGREDHDNSDTVSSDRSHRRSQQIDWKSFSIHVCLGDGSFGDVFLGSLKKDSKTSPTECGSKFLAIKRMKKVEIHRQLLVDNIKLEKYILKNIQSTFIPKLHSTFQDDHYYYMAMEWAQGGDVFSLLNNKRRKPLYMFAGEPAIRFILGCVILGLEELHNNNIAYRDLKP
jgi:serine/threonine protein kinase